MAIFNLKSPFRLNQIKVCLEKGDFYDIIINRIKTHIQSKKKKVLDIYVTKYHSIRGLGDLTVFHLFFIIIIVWYRYPSNLSKNLNSQFTIKRTYKLISRIEYNERHRRIEILMFFFHEKRVSFSYPYILPFNHSYTYCTHIVCHCF